MNTSATPSRSAARTHKSPEERRAEILSAAGRQFARDGYRATDVQHIADAIGIGKGTVYRLFPTKEALFLATVDGAVEALRVRLFAAVEPLDDPLEKIRAAVHAYLAFFEEQPEVVELFIQERAEFGEQHRAAYFARADEDRADWFRLFDQLREQGRMRALDSEGAGEALGSMLFGTILAHRMRNSDQRLTESAGDLLEIFLDGILTGERA